MNGHIGKEKVWDFRLVRYIRKNIIKMAKPIAIIEFPIHFTQSEASKKYVDQVEKEMSVDYFVIVDILNIEQINVRIFSVSNA